MRPKSILLVVAAFALAGCGIAGLSGPSGGPYPDACESLGFPARQCEAIVAVAQANASIAPETVISIDILPPSSQGSRTVGGQTIARVRFHRSDQPDQTLEVRCVGVTRDSAIACDPNAQIGIYGGLDHDVPCTGEPPDGCATLPPSPRPQIQAIARPLRVGSLEIPVDHLGPYEVEVGEAGLPDGALSSSSAMLAEPEPETFWIANGIRIDVRPVDPARPPVGSVYRESFDGVEQVQVFLVFDVTELKSDSVLHVRDLVVE